MPQSILVGCLSALLLSWLFTTLMKRWAPTLRLIDQPAQRKVHTTPTPTGGGVAIYAALVLTTCLLALLGWTDKSFTIVLAVGGIVVLIGLMDDLKPLSWKLRLGVHVAAAIAILGWPVEASWSLWFFGIFWIVGLINAFNMLDNMDALSSGTAWIVAALYAVFLAFSNPVATPTDWASSWPASLPFVLLLFALTGFLWFARPPAEIFMGDAGSTFLGFFLGVSGVQISFSSESTASPCLTLCFFAIPWYDLTTVVLIRLRQGRSPFQADKQHLSHRLVQLGLSHPAAVGAIHLLALTVGGLGLAVFFFSGYGNAGAGTVVIAAWCLLAVSEYLAHRLK